MRGVKAPPNPALQLPKGFLPSVGRSFAAERQCRWAADGDREEMHKVNLTEKLALITEHWRPKVVGELNGQEVKLAKFKGTFVWHHHVDEDELFLGISGHFRVEFRDGVIEVGPGEFVIVPRGV